MAEVRMPKMGDGMEEGTINTWLKQEGQQVTSGEPLAEVETDKANVEIVSYETGILTKIITQVGQTVAVGEVIAIIGIATGTGNGKKTHEAAPSNESAPARKPAESIAPTAPGKATDESRTTERIKSSPLARRMAQELSIDLARVTGSGPGGRIIERDITAYREKSGDQPASTSSVDSTPSAPPQQIKPSKMRDAIARRTVQSKQTIPHFYVSMIVEMDRGLKLTKEMSADGDLKITVNDLIIKACASALLKIPEVNSSWTGEGTVRRYSQAHIGVAVGIDEGLIIPVIRDCQNKSLRQISAEAKGLIAKARSGQLVPADYSGGTFTVSNLGMMGVDEFIAIINPPEAAILAIGGIVREPVVKDNDEIVIRSRMKITISADHRVCDGVIAARFVQEVKKSLEAPFTLVS